MYSPSGQNDRTTQWVLSQVGMRLAKSPSDADLYSTGSAGSSIDLGRSIGTLGTIPIQNLSYSSLVTTIVSSGSAPPPTEKSSSSKIFGSCGKNIAFQKLFNTVEAASSNCVLNAFDKAMNMEKCADKKKDAKEKFKAEMQEKGLICKAIKGDACPRFGFGKYRTMKDMKNLAYQLTEEELFYEYLDKHQVEKVLHTLLTLVCLEQPEDPFAYMKKYLGQLLRAREHKSEFEKIPRIFTTDHFEAVFRLLDKANVGFITMAQYNMAMEDIFGMEEYNKEPQGSKIRQIMPEIFIHEAKRAMDRALVSTIRSERNVPPENVKDKNKDVLQ